MNQLPTKTCALLCGIGLALTAAAQNPIISSQFTADPTARLFNGRVYLYPSHDIVAPEGQRQDWFCMADYHVYSSDNLIDWTDHGVIISQENVPWGKPDGYSMWAPDCVEKDGKYYFYFPNAPKSGRGFAIGVGVADRPEGPFKLEQEPIKGVSGIDPCVLIDNDGSAYLYWSGMGIRGGKLKANMKELDGELQEVRMSPPNNQENAGQGPRRQPQRILVGGQQMEGLPEGFKEGPFAFRRGDWYYLTFPWVRGDTSNGQNPTETLAYAMSRNPLGPWDFKGIIMAEHDNHCWTNHHSLLERDGQWYLFYHRNYYSPNMDKRRSACIEKVTFNGDGTIREVKPTLRGVGTMPATHRIDIDRYSAVADGVTVNYLDTTNYFNGWSASLPAKHSWVRFNDVDFSTVKDGYVVVRAKASDNTTFCIREGNRTSGMKSATGKVIARVPMTVKTETTRPGSPTPFRRDQSNQWLTLTAPLEYTPKGIVDIVVTAEGPQAGQQVSDTGDAAVSIDWVQFKNRPDYFTPVSATAAPAKPDDSGFIRRWLLLEPIKQDIRSNTVFTNTWLREVFTKPYFKDQLTVTPKDGQKVRVEKQNLVWRAMDSNMFNVKLFRFAEKYGDQTYGSLFWGVTYIDCAEDISNVRLAAGSNGASIWWLNGEEVLLLEGDRRMVEDDGMSARLTLKKGRNVLRCAVVNGPGLSDMCVRFLDEAGNPVTNYELGVRN